LNLSQFYEEVNTMTADQNKASLRRLLNEVVNQKRIPVFDEITTADFVEHEQLGPGLPPNREGAKQFFVMLHSAFPDLRATIEDEVAEGDKVVARSSWSGTHQGEFQGIPATGKRVTFQVIDIARFENGKAVEHWGQADIMGLMQQLGAIPAPGPISS
jgi:predicted ester cyclase